MIREFIKPVDNTYVLNLPDEMVGKTVEVIVFEIDNNEKLVGEVISIQNITDIKEKYTGLPAISHDNYKFNREEANGHE